VLISLCFIVMNYAIVAGMGLLRHFAESKLCVDVEMGIYTNLVTELLCLMFTI